jgi:NADPH:quinone reductase-like Zn-dependent oxidoreductase
MTRYVLNVPPGAWLLQTAAGSALGQMVIRLGRQYGFKTINVVRRREQAEELLQAGGDAAICTSHEAIETRVQAITGGEGVPFALDAVGGATGSAVVKALGNKGRLLCYGTLAEEPLSFDPRVLMVGQKRVEGFWLSEWVRGQSVFTMLGLFRRLRKLLAGGVLTSSVSATYPLEEIQTAVKHAATPGHGGKILLRMQ